MGRPRVYITLTTFFRFSNPLPNPYVFSHSLLIGIFFGLVVGLQRHWICMKLALVVIHIAWRGTRPL